MVLVLLARVLLDGGGHRFRMASLIWFASLDVVDGCLGVLVCSCVLGVVVSLVLVWFCISFCVWAWSGGALLVCLFRRIYIIGVFWMPDFYILRFFVGFRHVSHSCCFCKLPYRAWSGWPACCRM